jgi:hypothetical protein
MGEDPFRDWHLPSPEGTLEPAELESNFARATATLQIAFEHQDAELHATVLEAASALFAAALDLATHPKRPDDPR